MRPPIIADLNHPIPLGQRGENEATVVKFPKFGTGTYALLAQRSGDANPYPVVITEDDTYVIWTVSSTDCGIEGMGKCELHLVDDTYLEKTLVYTTVTGKALGTAGEMPEPYEDWSETIYGYAQTAQASAGDASQSADDAAASAREAAESASVFTLTDPNNDGNIIIGGTNGNS